MTAMSDEAHHKDHSTNQPDEASPLVKQTIVLVGLMGAGKTTVGRRLARRLGLEFADSDFEIEKAAQMSVADIFSIYGEDYFRAGERRVISRLMGGPPRVLATGGGAFINDETRSLMKEKSITIWLDASLGVLVERTSRRDTRPLLQGKDPEGVLKKLLADREPIYATADIKIQSSDGPHDMVVDNIISTLKNKGLIHA